MFKIRSKHSLVRALGAAREHLSREAFEHARSYERMGDVYIVDRPDVAEYLGVKWIGRPYVIYPLWRYDWFDHLFAVAELFWYVASGAEADDECREADEQMLANAY